MREVDEKLTINKLGPNHLFKLEPTSTSALDRADLANVASEPELEE